MTALLSQQSGYAQVAALHAGVMSAREHVQQAIAEIHRLDHHINSFTQVTEERALREADEIDRRRRVGEDPGPLAGLLYSVKNLFDLEGVVTRAGSKILRTSAPASRDATLVDRLRRAGAICVGAVNMGEFAYDFVTENGHDGPTRNPRALDRSAGGSSGGSGAAVAAGLSAISLGSDTNGSIRVPASFCGVFGLKPTFGRLGRGGAFPFVANIDHLGPLARTVRDLALVYDAMQGPDPRDSGWVARPVEPSLPSLDRGLNGLRIGVLGGYFSTGGAPEVHAAVQQIAAALGCGLTFEFPEAKLARTAGYLITAAEGGLLHRQRLQDHPEDFEPITRDRLLAGALLPGQWYTQAQKFRRWWCERVREVFQEVDVLLAPATPVTATTLGQPTLWFNGEELPVRPNLGVYTQPISLAGLPVVAVPVSTPSGLPCAVQLIGAPWREASLLRVAQWLETTGFCRAPVATLPV